jgi:hypothetical protein
MTEKPLWCGTGGTFQKNALSGARENCSEGNISLETFCEGIVVYTFITIFLL